MILYHGSAKKFSSFRQKGKKGEFRVQGRRCVWLGSDIEKISRKYGKQGYLYKVEVAEDRVVPYAQKRAEEGLNKKTGTSGVYVAPACEIKILSCQPM